MNVSVQRDHSSFSESFIDKKEEKSKRAHLKQSIDCKKLHQITHSCCEKNLSVEVAIDKIVNQFEYYSHDKITELLIKSKIISNALIPEWTVSYKFENKHILAEQEECINAHKRKKLNRKGKRWTEEEEQLLIEAANLHREKQYTPENFAHDYTLISGREYLTLLARLKKLKCVIVKNDSYQWLLETTSSEDIKKALIINGIELFVDFDFQGFINNQNNPILAPMLNELITRYQKDTTQLSEGFFMSMPIPTGIGKTYNTMTLLLIYILLRIQSQLNEKKKSKTKKNSLTTALFMTDQKINVDDACNTLTEQIEKSIFFTKKQKNYLLQSYMRVLANDASVLKNLANDNLMEIANICRFNDEVQSQIKDLKTLYNIVKDSKSDDNATAVIEEKLAQDTRQLFRKCVDAIRKWIKDNAKIYEENIEIFNTFLPASKLHNSAYVIFSTTTKAIYGFDTVYTSINMQSLKGSLILIDEFDKQNAVIYSTLLEQAKRNKIELTSTIRTIKNAIEGADIQTDPAYIVLKRNSTQFLNDIKNLWDLYHMDSSFDLDGKISGAKLFLSRGYISMYDQKGSASVDYNEKENKNIVTFHKDKKIEYEEISSLSQFVSKCDLILNYDFPYKILASAQSFMQVRNKYVEKDISLEVAVTTVLAALNLGRLSSHVMERFISTQRILKNRKGTLVNNYHDTGLKSTQALTFKNTLEHIDFKHFSIPGSATGFLANIIQKVTTNNQGNGVIGISATANTKTLLHNFDIEYMNRFLGEQYIELSKRDKEAIRDYYDTYRPYAQKGISLSVSAVEHSSMYLQELIPKCSNKSLQYYLDKCDNDNKNNDAFIITFTTKLISSIEHFFTCKSNRYMVCFLGRGLSKRYKGIIELIKDAITYFEKQYSCESSLYPDVNTYYYEKKYAKEVLAELKNTTKKVIVISSFNTLGKGFNGQYEFNKNNEKELVQLLDKAGTKTDIDSLYIEIPMSKFIFNNSDDLFDQKLTVLNQLLLLQENGSFSITEVKKKCQNVVSAKEDSINNIVKRIRANYSTETEDYLYSVWADIEQVVGRAARTSVKRKEIVLMLDEAVMPVLKEDKRDLSLSSHEYRAIIDFAQKYKGKAQVKDKKLKAFTKMAITNTCKGVLAIRENKNTIFMDRPKEFDKASTQYKDACMAYKDSRNFILKYPTLKDRNTIAQEYVKLYLFTPNVANCYRYAHDADDSQLNLESYDFFNSNHPREITMYKAHLDKLSKNKLIVEVFNTLAIPLTWDDGEAIITPPVFWSLYKGALGEKVVEVLLNYCDINTTELENNEFELMDFIIDNKAGKKLPLDVKFWEHEYSKLNEEDNSASTIHKTLRKSKQLGYKSAVLCGVFAHEDNLVQYFNKEAETCSLQEASIMSVSGILSIHDSSLLLQSVKAIKQFIELKGIK